MKIIPQKCPCCEAPVDLAGLKIAGECNYCQSNLTVTQTPAIQDAVGSAVPPSPPPPTAAPAADFVLTANPDKKYVSTACPETSMRCTSSLSAPPAPLVTTCPEEMAAKEAARARLNESRATLPPPPVYNQFHEIENMTLTERLWDGVVFFVKLPFTIIEWIAEGDDDGHLGGRVGRRRYRRRYGRRF